MYRGHTAFYDVNLVVLTDVYNALADSIGGLPERACLVPGEIAWDECDCGMLALSVEAWELSEGFPNDGGFNSQGPRTGPCDLPWVVGDVQLQLIRCAPSPTGNVLSVPCPALDAAAQVLITDAAIVIETVNLTLCAMKAADEIVDFMITGQQAVGPGGGCVGTSLSFQLALER